MHTMARRAAALRDFDPFRPAPCRLGVNRDRNIWGDGRTMSGMPGRKLTQSQTPRPAMAAIQMNCAARLRVNRERIVSTVSTYFWIDCG